MVECEDRGDRSFGGGGGGGAGADGETASAMNQSMDARDAALLDWCNEHACMLFNSAGVLQSRGMRLTTDDEPGLGIGVDMGEELCDMCAAPGLSCVGDRECCRR